MPEEAQENKPHSTQGTESHPGWELNPYLPRAALAFGWDVSSDAAHTDDAYVIATYVCLTCFVMKCLRFHHPSTPDVGKQWDAYLHHSYLHQVSLKAPPTRVPGDPRL